MFSINLGILPCLLLILEVIHRYPKNTNQCSSLNDVKAAFETFRYTGKLNKTFPGIEGKLKSGVGIHTGQVGIAMGNTAMGDTVNLAFRLESASKSLKCDLVMSETTYESLPKNLWQGT